MKQALCLILLCALLMCPLGALCEAAPAEALSFGDFTLTLSPDTPGELYEKADNSVLFILYPLYLEKGDVRSNLNAVWTDQYLTADQMRDETLLNQLVDYIKSNVAAQYETAGINMLRMDVVSTGLTQIGGLNAFYYVYSSTLSVQETVMDIYTKGTMVSGDFGTYTFTGTSTNMESLELFFDPLLSTLAWN